MIQPQNDRVLIQRIDEQYFGGWRTTPDGKGEQIWHDSPSGITLTDRSKSIKGLVLAVGPGKWIPGEWWKVGFKPFRWPVVPENTVKNEHGWWEWFPGHREPLVVKPGMKVLFNSKWNDFAAGENKGTGADLSGPLERPLPIKADQKLHLVQESDIFAIVEHFDFRASVQANPNEQVFMQNIATVGI